MTNPPQPLLLNLTLIRMPVGALISFGNLLSGIVLAVGVPMCVYLLDHSLQNAQGFADVTSLLRHGGLKWR